MSDQVVVTPSPLRRLIERPGIRLVVDGLRLAMASFDALDPCCLDRTYDNFAGTMPEHDVDDLVGHLIALTRRLRQAGSMQTYPLGCRHLARDEHAVVALIAACQAHNNGRAADIIASLERRDIHGVRRPGQRIAELMERAGLFVGALTVPLDAVEGHAPVDCATPRCPWHRGPVPLCPGGRR
jgi:hypothetical protein